MNQTLDKYIDEKLRESTAVWEAIGPDGVLVEEGVGSSMACMMQGLYLGVLIKHAIATGDCSAVGRAIVAQARSYLEYCYDLEMLDDGEVIDDYAMRIEEDNRRAKEEAI